MSDHGREVVTSSAPAPLLFALPESEELARTISRLSGVALAPLEERRFEAGEFKLRPLTSVRDREIFVVQSLANSPQAPVSERLVRLLFLLYGLRDAGAARITLLIPYLAFARKDRRTQPRDPVSSRYIAQLLEAPGIDRLIALDAHNPAAFDNAFRSGTDHLSAIPLFVDHFARHLADVTALAVASPDVGGVKRAQLFREQLERRLARAVELVFIEKRRVADVVSGGLVVGDCSARTTIILDDLCASGGTLIRASAALRAAGAREVHAAFTHAPLPEGLSALAACGDLAQVVLTDSVGTPLAQLPAAVAHRLTVLGIAPLFGAVISRLVAHRPLAPLLERFPPADAS
ncbi:MAG TPA: ribose-phosphate diphosphokinase [Steroidobacteraceae bacterium]|nr:ribose-phosphate diphosphokinase [Steroidobacteraceae bacterium]